MSGWMTCSLIALSTVFQTYGNNKSCVYTVVRFSPVVKLVPELLALARP